MKIGNCSIYYIINMLVVVITTIYSSDINKECDRISTIAGLGVIYWTGLYT